MQGHPTKMASDNEQADKAEDLSKKPDAKAAASSGADTDSDSDAEEHHGENTAGVSGGASGASASLPGDSDELTRLRREKRLAMNRESARARRKRKKVLLETLEQQVADLAKRNQRYQVVNESLTSQVRQLEADLAVARSTIAFLTGQGNLPGIGAGSDFASQDAIRRLLQAQSFPSALGAGGAAPSALFGGVSAEEALLQRSRSLDIQNALSQVSRDAATANALGRLGQAGSRPAVQSATAAAILSQSTQHDGNELAMPPEYIIGGRRNDTYSRLAGLGDSVNASYSSQNPGNAGHAQMLELLKQQASKKDEGFGQLKR